MPAGLKDSELEAQIQLEADQYIPYSLEEVNLDFHVMGPSADASNMVDVLLAASRSENVEDRTAAAEIGGMNVRVVDIEPYTMEASFELISHQLPENGEGQTVAVLDIGASMTSLCVCLLYTSPSPRDATLSRMPSSA